MAGLGTAELRELETKVQDAERETAYWALHAAEHQAQYPEQFVAVAPDRGTVIATTSDLQDLVLALRERGLNLADVWSRFVPAAGHGFIL